MDNKKIKVAIVINDFLVGGAQKLIADMVTRFDKDRFEIVLVTLFLFEKKESLYRLLPSQTSLHKLTFSSFSDIRSWFALISVLRAERPDVVVSNLFFSNTIMRILKLIVGYECITVEHNTYIHKTKLQIFCDRLLAKLTYAIVAVSSSARKFTSSQEKIPLSKFRVIYNGIDIDAIEEMLAIYDKKKLMEELGLSPNRRYIVDVARLVSQKNHALLLEGFSRFAKTHSEYDLLIVGGGGLQETLMNQTRKLDLEHKVHFFGNQRDVFRFYYLSEFFVSTSTIEGFGLAHVEALACGLPLVSTKTAGPDEMIDEGKNGFFIKEETADGVATALGRMNDAHPHSMREASRQTASHFDIRETVRAYEALIEESMMR